MRVTLRRLLIAAGCALVLASAPVTRAPAQQQPGNLDLDLPELGDPSATVLSPAEERRIGREFMQDARRQLTFVDDPELKSYVEDLGRRIAGSSNLPAEEFHFYLIADPTLNAFAVPGGHVSVHTGLIAATRTESELAGVIAHEVAHVTQRHLPRMIAQSQQAMLPTLGAILAAVLIGGQAGAAAVASTNAAMLERQLAYSRDFEREADSLGIRTLARAGFDPDALPGFFEQMQEASRIYESSAPEFLRSHPLTYKRIAESRSRAESYSVGEVPSSSRYLHMREKVRALFESAGSYMREETAAVDREEAALARRYGEALSLMAERRYDEARAAMGALAREHPDRPYYAVGRAEIETAAGNFGDALEILEAAAARFPEYTPLERYRAGALLRTGDAAGAKRVLRKLLRSEPPDAALYGMLARAAGDMDQLFEAHQALAEQAYLQGELREALRQLDRALSYAGDSEYARASAEARIREISAELQRREQQD